MEKTMEEVEMVQEEKMSPLNLFLNSKLDLC